jgi:hypothetical protein
MMAAAWLEESPDATLSGGGISSLAGHVCPEIDVDLCAELLCAIEREAREVDLRFVRGTRTVALSAEAMSRLAIAALEAWLHYVSRFERTERLARCAKLMDLDRSGLGLVVEVLCALKANGVVLAPAREEGCGPDTALDVDLWARQIGPVGELRP